MAEIEEEMKYLWALGKMLKKVLWLKDPKSQYPLDSKTFKHFSQVQLKGLDGVDQRPVLVGETEELPRDRLQIHHSVLHRYAVLFSLC